MVEQRRERRGGGEWVPESEKFAAGFYGLDGCRPCGGRAKLHPITPQP